MKTNKSAISKRTFSIAYRTGTQGSFHQAEANPIYILQWLCDLGKESPQDLLLFLGITIKYFFTQLMKVVVIWPFVSLLKINRYYHYRPATILSFCLFAELINVTQQGFFIGKFSISTHALIAGLWMALIGTVIVLFVIDEIKFVVAKLKRG